MILRIGVTAGIGAGKSSVCKEFQKFGIPVYYMDDWAKWVMVNNYKVRSQLIELLGEDAYQPDGLLNRKYIANIIFNNKETEAKLQAIIRDPLREHLENWVKTEDEKSIDCHYCLIENAVFYESRSSDLVDIMLGVDAPAEIRIERAMKRDGSTKEDVLQRMRKQEHDRNMEYCDFVLTNSTKEAMERRVKKLHLIFVKLAYLGMGYSVSRQTHFR